MKMFIIMLFISLGVVTTSQAQDLTNVQNEKNYLFSSSTTLDVLDDMNFVKTKVIVFVYTENTELNSIKVITSDEVYANVLKKTYNLEHHKTNGKGKHVFYFGNSVSEARIYTNLISSAESKGIPSGGRFHIHRVTNNLVN